MRALPSTALLLVLALSSLPAGVASADTWPLARHDAGRTGAASGPVPMASPNVAWRAYVGGYPADFDSRFGIQGPSGIVTSEGGRFVARNTVTQALLWKSPLLGSGYIVDTADLDGDTKPEVIVRTDSQAHVLDGATGALRWSSPPDEIQIMGQVHVLDLDGDHLPDVYLDNGIGAKYGTKIAQAFSFAGGTAHEIWSLPLTFSPPPTNAGQDALMDLDGDGLPEIILASFQSAAVVRGSDGSTIGLLQPPGPPTGDAFFEATALSGEFDGQPGREILMFQDYPLASMNATPGIIAFKFDVATGQSQQLWAADIGTYDGEQVMSADMVSDLNGDGLDEVIFSFRNGTHWKTEVFAGGTGQVIATVDDSRFEGAADLDGNPGKEVVLATAAGLGAYALTNGALVPMGQPLPGLRAFSTKDPTLYSPDYITRRLSVVQGPGGKPMVLAGTPTGSPGPYDATSTFTSLSGLELVSSNGASSLQAVATYTPLVGAITGTMKADFATRPYAQIAVGNRIGTVSVLDQHLKPTNGVIWLNGDALGTFVGGYGAVGPALVSADAMGPFVYFPTTYLGAVAANVQAASFILPPIPRWSSKTLTSASVLDIGGSAHVVGVEDKSVVARRTDTGAIDGTISMPTGSIRGTPLPLHVAGQPQNYVGVDWLVGGGQVAQTKLDFGSQTVAWQSPTLNWAGYFGSSAGDLDGDGTDEWYTVDFGNLYKRDANTGNAVTLANFPNLSYALPMLATFKGASSQMLLQSGWEGPRLVDATSGANLWPDPAPVDPANGMAGARALCNGVPRFVYPALESAHLHAYDGITGALVAEKVYAGGHAYATDQDAIAAGDRPGTLSNPNAVANLAGSPAALAGSSDGYLYAVDPCTLDLRWAANIGVSLGEPIIADVDGDGEDEIVVSGADGFYYGLDKSWFPAPVLSVTGDTGGDVVEKLVGESVTVTWQPVTGASEYEYGLVGPDEKPIQTPAYQSTTSTSATIALDGALANRPYRLSVRAKGASGPGTEALSKPVAVKDTTNPTAKVTPTDGATLALAFDAADDLALDHYELAVQQGQSAAVIADDGMLKGKQATGNLSFTPDKSQWGQDVTVQVTIFDSAGLKNVTALSAHIDTNGIVTTGPGTPISDPQGMDPSGPGGTATTPKTSDTVSCSCSVGTDDGSPTGWLLGSVLAGATILRRRRAKKS